MAGKLSLFQQKSKDTPLHVAVSSSLGGGDPRMLRLLLDNGANKLIRNAKGQLPLEVAFESRKLHCVKLLSGKHPVTHPGGTGSV